MWTERVRAAVLRHRVAVGAVWLLVLLLGAAAAVLGLGRLDQSFTASGGPGHAANRAIQERYGNGAAVAPLVAVVTWPTGTDVRAGAPGSRTPWTGRRVRARGRSRTRRLATRASSARTAGPRRPWSIRRPGSRTWRV